MIDIRMYSELKEKGLVSLAKVGDAYVASWKTFNPLTGEELKPVTEAFDLESIEALKKDSEVLIGSLDAFLADLKALV